MAGLLRVPLRSIGPGDLVLEPDVARYVTRVHRLGPDDEFVAFDPESRTEADVRVVDVGRRVRCRVGDVRPARAVAKTGITLIQALGKGDKPDRVIRESTALGAERVVFCLSRRTVVHPGERAASRLERWRAVAVDAARQSGRGDVPAIHGPMELAAALVHGIPAPALRLCLAPGASQSFAAALRGFRRGDPVALLIGPEGGFDDQEVDLAAANGFVPVTFGEFTLRTETAAVAALGALVGRE